MLVVIDAGLEPGETLAEAKFPDQPQLPKQAEIAVNGSKRDVRHPFPDQLINLIRFGMTPLGLGKLVENDLPLAGHAITLLFNFLIERFDSFVHYPPPFYNKTTSLHIISLVKMMSR